MEQALMEAKDLLLLFIYNYLGLLQLLGICSRGGGTGRMGVKNEYLTPPPHPEINHVMWVCRDV